MEPSGKSDGRRENPAVATVADWDVSLPKLSWTERPHLNPCEEPVRPGLAGLSKTISLSGGGVISGMTASGPRLRKADGLGSARLGHRMRIGDWSRKGQLHANAGYNAALVFF
jgi:hypothetical protein